MILIFYPRIIFLSCVVWNCLQSSLLTVQKLCFYLSPLYKISSISSFLNVITLRNFNQNLCSCHPNFLTFWMHIWDMKLVQIYRFSPQTISISSMIQLWSGTNVKFTYYMSAVRAHYLHIAWWDIIIIVTPHLLIRLCKARLWWE